MKKIVFTIVFTGLFVGLFGASTPAADRIAVGTGTSQDPYKIGSIAELYFMRDKTNSSDADAAAYRGAYYELVDDLNLEAEDDWTPICCTTVASAAFSGSFDGNGHTISNLKYGTSDVYSVEIGKSSTVGFFGMVKTSGSIANLNIDRAAFYVTVPSGEFYNAGIAGLLQAGTINNCTVNGIFMSKQPNNTPCNVGGIVGKVNTPSETVKVIIANCSTSGTMAIQLSGTLATSNMCVGGIVGSLTGTTSKVAKAYMLNCYSTADVSATTTSGPIFVGGIAGQVTIGTSVEISVQNCYASGNIYGKTTGANAFVSGISGRINSATANITNCIAMNQSVKLEKNADCWRVAEKSAGNLVGNYALAEDQMILQKKGTDWENVAVVSSISDVHGKTLEGATFEEQIGDGLKKLNDFVDVNPDFESIDLIAWDRKSGFDYPVFKTTNNNTAIAQAQVLENAVCIVNMNGGVEVSADNLSQLFVYNAEGRLLTQVNASGEKAFAGIQKKGFVILTGLDENGNRLFVKRHILK